MSRLIILFCLFLSSGVNSQDLAYDFVFYDKNHSTNEVEILLMNDSARQVYERDYLDVFTGEWEVFHRESEYKKGNTKINIILREDNRVLYRFFVDSNVVQNGELVIDSTRFIIELNYDDSLDKTFNDTMYYLQPGKNWSVNYSNSTRENGEYVNGQKEGDWVKFDYKIGYFPIGKKTFSEGKLISSKSIGTVHKKSVDANIVNTWKGFGYLEYDENNGLTLLHREGAKKTRRLTRNGQLWSIYLEEDKKFHGHRHFTCGSGNYGGEYWNPKGKWEVLQKGNDFFLVLNKVEYKIVYLTEDILVID